jgi:hypothetical protein
MGQRRYYLCLPDVIQVKDPLRNGDCPGYQVGKGQTTILSNMIEFHLDRRTVPT